MTSLFVNVRLFVTRIVVKNREYSNEVKKVGLSNRLKEYRSSLGLNQTELGKLAGVSRQTISLIERGDYSPSVALALKLAQICEVKVEDIFQLREDEEC